MKIVDSVLNRIDAFSRRSFLKGLAATGTAAAMYGCSKDDDREYVYVGGGSSNTEENIAEDIRTGAAEVYAGTAGHNCGGRCVTRAVKKNGKIVRILSDETYVETKFQEHVADPRSRACSRCRSYVGRLYHPGRMKYPLKQTLERGNLNGFVRISWDQAIEEIAAKYSAIAGKYGDEAIYNHMSSGQQGPFNRAGGGDSASQFSARLGPLSGGFLYHAQSYSSHQIGYFGYGFTGSTANSNAQNVATRTNTLVMWGMHSLTTSNSVANANIQAAEKIRERDGKIYHINPTLEDTGITLATDWVQIRPYTDTALMLALMHQMIVNSFDENGNPLSRADSWLDLDYIDTMVYGFFDSPAYWLNESTGYIELDEPADTTGYRKVEAVEAGKSLSAYIMGNNPLLTRATYGVDPDGGSRVNYLSAEFGSKGLSRNGATCSYITQAKAAASAYYYKKDLLVEKTPAWAEKICGVPAEEITALAKRLCKDTPVCHLVSNGWQRNSEGVHNLFALQSLCILTKSWGMAGSGFVQGAGGLNPSFGTNGASISASTVSASESRVSGYFYNNVPKIPSCTIWHDGVKFGFNVAEAGYTAEHIPHVRGKVKDYTYGNSFVGDSNIKSLVKHVEIPRTLDEKLATDAKERYEVITLEDGYEYYKWEEDASGNAIPVGIRFIFTMAGNAIINQHMNANDTAEFLSKLPITAPDDADGFCYMALDTNFSPTMRWADYALPGAANWEMVDLVEGAGGAQQIYMPAVIPPPGEAKSGYDVVRLMARELGRINPQKYGRAAEHLDNGKTPDDYIEEGFYAIKNSTSTATATLNAKEVYKKWDTYEDYKRDGYLLRTPLDYDEVSTADTPLYAAYLEAADEGNYTLDIPFVNPGKVLYTAGTTTYYHQVTTNTGATYRNTSRNSFSGYAVYTDDPAPSGRFHVYSDMLVWEYRHRNEKFHGYLPEAERGNKNIDEEGDPIVHPIPIYYGYKDYFREAYGEDMFAANNPADKPLMVLGTHIRYRSHSTFNDSPLMRELGKAAVGGGIPSDMMEYSDVISSVDDSGKVTMRRLGSSYGSASGFGYERLWLNPEDAADRGINEGDLVVAGNAVGKVRAVASTSYRVPKGTAVLPQGGWYDPDPVDGIDDGGCANTICASLPSRCDHGNAQMTSLIKVARA